MNYYNVYKDNKLIMKDVTAKQISEAIGRSSNYIKASANYRGGCHGYKIEKSRKSLNKNEMIELEWDREIKNIKELFEKAFENKNVVTSSARSYRK